MAVQQIKVVGDGTLTKKCKLVKKMTGHIMDLIGDVFETIHETNGYDLTAPRVGVLKRVFVVDMDDGNQYVVINPEIITQGEGQTSYESCLDLSGKLGIMTRPNRVEIRVLNENMGPAEAEGEGLLARIPYRKYVHLEGQMYTGLAEGELVDTDPETGEKIIEE